MTRITQTGRSMVEMLGVLAIIGVLSVGGLAGYSMAMAKFKTNKALEQITLMVTQIRTLYANSSNFTGMTMNDLSSMGIIGTEICPTVGTCSNTVAKNPFNGAVDIGPVGALAAGAPTGSAAVSAGYGFYVSYAGVPKDACIQYFTSNWGGSGSGFLGMGTATTARVYAPDSSDATKRIPSLSDASTTCGTTGTSTVVWFYN